MKAPLTNVARTLTLIAFAGLLFGAGSEFRGVASGTGRWIADFSLRWGILFIGFVLLAVLIWVSATLVIWDVPRVSVVFGVLAVARERLGAGRWLLAGVVALLPVLFLQYTAWGIVFSEPYIRLLAWLASAVTLAYLFSAASKRSWTWYGLVAGLLASGAVFALAVPFQQVTTYPFALGWSEGNRLWDYSLLFGSRLYRYPVSQQPTAYLEPGRLFVGGLPYLIPNLSISAERLWLATLETLPYLLLGWAAFRAANKGRRAEWIFAGIWGFVFLTQGPVHPPLLICAILVALAWGRPLWLAASLVLLSGYFAELSRFTWIFAPAMWAVMLEFGSFEPVGDAVPAHVWKRSLTIAAAGLTGSLILPKLLAWFGLEVTGPGSAPGVSAGGVSVEALAGAATRQPLLWYRLFPNATYGSGILVGVLIAAGPLLAVLLYLAFRGWKLNVWQKLAIALPLAAFLAVGLVTSTKIGGGGDLHNLDQFLIGLLFAATLAWRSVGLGWSESLPPRAVWVRGALLLALAVPAFQPLMALHPISFAEDTDWLVVLTDSNRPKDLGSLPPGEAVDTELQQLRAEIRAAQGEGDILFIDQRQLLTFGYIGDVELVWQYEKKRMMDEALSGNAAYFEIFYKDLAAHRFTMIVTDPLRTPIKDSEYGFGEENNAWVKWVARPVLCYYEEKDTLTQVKVELLVPRSDAASCASELP